VFTAEIEPPRAHEVIARAIDRNVEVVGSRGDDREALIGEGSIDVGRCAVAAGGGGHRHATTATLDIGVPEQREVEPRRGRPAIVGAHVEAPLLPVVEIVALQEIKHVRVRTERVLIIERGDPFGSSS
jgi:hypothetical protein